MMTIKNFQWQKHSKFQIPAIREIFGQMWRYYDNYLESTEDIPYWSTEMALVGNLAMAAAQLKKYPAALEFFNEKAKRKRLKRADLWLGLDQNDLGLIVEAKRDWISLRLKEQSISQHVMYYLKEADDYLDDLRTMASWGASLFFAQVYITKRAMSLDYPASVKGMIKECEAVAKYPRNNISFLAYYFLEDKQEVEKRWSDHYKCSYPGIVTFGRIWRA